MHLSILLSTIVYKEYCAGSTSLVKRKYLQGKRGIEKPPFRLPDFIKATGVMEMRQALDDKEDQKSVKAKTRERVWTSV